MLKRKGDTVNIVMKKIGYPVKGTLFVIRELLLALLAIVLTNDGIAY